jgi:hypothetical protein
MSAGVMDNAAGVGSDARKIGAVENRALQRVRLEQYLFRLLVLAHLCQQFLADVSVRLNNKMPLPGEFG